jgi:hypothetical protein
MGQRALKEEPVEIEKLIKEYLEEARNRLETEFVGTREAIRQISEEKVMEYLVFTDKDLSKEERALLSAVFTFSMYQSFCYGYGIGRVEGSTSKKVYL